MQPVTTPSKSFVKGALILTVAALVTKILSAIYRIPFQNIVGDVGFYIYQQVYPIYGVALILATTGYPVILSKLSTEQRKKEGELGVQRLFLIAAIFLLGLGVLCFSFLYGGSDWLARQMNDPELAILIRVISTVFLLIPFIALMRGYFQGRGDMVPTAVSQVGEQFVRVGTILFTAYLFMKANASMYEVGGGAVFGSVTGGFTGIVILLAFLSHRKNEGEWKWRELLSTFRFQETLDILKILFVQGFAICVSGMLLLLMQLADSLNVYSLLLTSGMDGEYAKAAKGIYDRGQPLIQLGSVVATAMSLSLVPLIASEVFKRNEAVLREKINLAVRVSVTIGLGATVGLMTIIRPTNQMLFENGEGSDVLAILSITICLSSIIITLIAILQGLGTMIFPAVVVLFGFILKYGLNILLVPFYGTSGAAVASVGALVLILLILTYKLFQRTKKPMITYSVLLRILIAAGAMFILLKGFLFVSEPMYQFGQERIIASIQSLTGVLIGGITFLFVVIRMKVFSREEISLLPLGSKLLYLFPNKNRR